MIETLLKDLGFGVKLLWKERGFATTAILTLALCIGANAAIFSVVDSVLLQPLPFEESDRLMQVYNAYPNAGAGRASNSVPDFYDRRALDVFEEVAMYNYTGLNVGEPGSVERTFAMRLTPTLFPLLRVTPMLGRAFTEEEGEVGSNRVVILNHALWQRLHGGDREVLASALRVNGEPYTIVGVMPPDFVFMNPDVDLWMPLAFTEEQRSDNARHSNSWQMVARLAPGATVARAQEQVDVLNDRVMGIIPELEPLLIEAGYHTIVVPLEEDLVRDVEATLYLLWGGAAFVLLIGCVNIANLVLVRSSVRLRELATRSALGAGKVRIGGQLLTESLLLTLLGGALGLLIGYWGLRVLGSLGVSEMPRGSEVRMDWTALGFTFVLALLVGLVIGLIPVLKVARMNLGSVIREEGRTGTSARGTRWLRNGLVVAQVSFALVLLVGAGLLLASFREVLSVDPGFDPQGVLTASLNPPGSRYEDGAALRAFTSRVLEGVRALPGVEAAGVTSTIPFGGSYSDSVIFAEGYERRPGESVISPSRLIVSPGYFEAMGIPLVEGRLFDDSDSEESARAIIVDDKLARRFWPDSSPIGKRMYSPNSVEDLEAPTDDADWFAVVGVVGEVTLTGLTEGSASVGAYYFPYRQQPTSFYTLAVRLSGEPTLLAEPVRRVIAEVDPELPLYGVQTMGERLEESLVSRRTPMLLSTSFGVAALLLSALGIYGVLAYLVATRTREIGVRIALGSSAGDIFGLVLREGLVIVAGGFLIGLAGTVSLRRTVESQLYGVSPLDPLVLGGVVILLGLVALIACLVPARRATRIDPVVALTQE